MINIDLEQKIALVTGGSRGIGQAIVKNLVQANAKVAYTTSSHDSLQKAKDTFAKMGIDAKGYVANQSVKEEINKMVSDVKQDMGSIDFLINNAGITKDNLLIRMTDEYWNSVIDTNLTGVFYTTREVIKIMVKKRFGRVINISSIVGFIASIGQTNYAATKAALVAFSRTLASELASRGINVNTVAPGYITTDMTDKIPEAIKDQINNQIPLKRPGMPEDVAYAVSFLCSSMANYITGTTLHINGGIY